MKKLPSFIIIGAMKSATTTLYEQLRLQEGIYLPSLKEPNFYSDNNVFKLGHEWYESLFINAKTDDIIGEASTHYTKLPTHPCTIPRLVEHNQKVSKFIYVMRHPVNRLISHYIHGWTENKIKVSINEAIFNHPELIEYSLYSKQLEPWLTQFGTHSILPVFFERFMSYKEEELNRVCKFIGYESCPSWIEDSEKTNVSSERIRRFPFYSILVDSQIAAFLRKNFVPVSLRNSIKERLQMKRRPVLSEDNIKYLQEIFNRDLAVLGTNLGIKLNCDNYLDTVVQATPNWIE
jgi:hypothetical protein